MNWLNRIPVWGWFVITFVIVYGTWNPAGYSATYLIAQGSDSIATRALLGLVVVAVYLVYLIETYRTFNTVGLVILAAIVGLSLYKAYEWGILGSSAAVWQWIAPGIIAFILTLGLQGGRIYRNATGRVPVSVDAPHIAPDHGTHGHG